MVLSFSNTLTVVAWFVQLGLNHTQCPHKPRHALSPHLQGGGQYNQFTSPSPVENCGRWVQSSIMLPWALFGAHRTCCYCINQVTAFQGQSSIFGNIAFHLDAMVMAFPVHLISCIYRRVSCQVTYLSQGISFLIARSVSALRAGIWKTVSMDSGSCR